MFKENFLSGAASVLNLTPESRACTVNIPIQDDTAAIASDWMQVGYDLTNTLENIQHEQRSKK